MPSSAQKVLLAGFWIAVAEATLKQLHVEKVENPTHAEEYRCVSDGDGVDPATNYTWYRQDWKALPEGVKAEENRLHFLILTSELNGLYFCEAEHNQGVTRASLYKYTKKDSVLSWMLSKAKTNMWVQALDYIKQKLTQFCQSQSLLPLCFCSFIVLYLIYLFNKGPGPAGGSRHLLLALR